MEEVKTIASWNVDTDNPKKILSVAGEATPEEIIKAVESKGFWIEAIEQ
jgi:hypothetical protein